MELIQAVRKYGVLTSEGALLNRDYEMLKNRDIRLKQVSLMQAKEDLGKFKRTFTEYADSLRDLMERANRLENDVEDYKERAPEGIVKGVASELSILDMYVGNVKTFGESALEWMVEAGHVEQQL